MGRFRIAVIVFACWALCTDTNVARTQTPDRKPSQHVLNIVVDPRLELLAAVQLLSGYGERLGLITRFDFPYKRDVIEHFSAYKKHRAVQLFAEMSKGGFSFDAPPAAMLYLSDPPDLNTQLPFTDYLNRRAGGQKRLNQFVSSLRDFARQTQFMTFFKSHQETYRQIVADARMKMEGIDYVGTLENYYGIKHHSYNIILVPLFVGGYGHRVERTDGACDTYNICGPISVENDLPVFGTVESFRDLAWHEFGHSFVVPTMNELRSSLAKYSSLYDPIADRMKKQAYPSWEICVNEHLVRAVTTRLAYREMGKEAAEKTLLYEKTKGFFYVEALCKQLEKYENERNKYQTFADFSPELINVFKKLAEMNLGDEFYSVPFTGTINAVVSDKKSVVLIVPTNESRKAVQDRIHTYVKVIHDRFFKDSPILTDTEALKKNLSNNSIIVYGTTAGNLWLAKHIAELPVRIRPDQIVTESTYSGTNLRFISAWPNPQNPQKGLVIYTAQQAEDVIDINSVFHGPTDYVVAKGTEILKPADYDKQGKRWTFK
jgi:hypothetical protein